jgi:hypothetical protein
MVNRRKLIKGVVTASAVAISGCSGDEGDPTGSTESEESDEETDTETSDGGTASEETASEEAEFEFVEWTTPSEVELNEEIEVGMVVKNTGSQAGDYTAPLYQRTPNSDWTRVSEVDFGTIQPDEEVEMVFEDVAYSYINRYALRLGDFQKTSVIQVLSAKIDWGTEYTTPNGYIISVDEPELQDSYEYEDYNGEVSPKEPDSGGQWAFLNAYVKNETGQSKYSPLAGDINLLYGSSQADGETILIDEPINKGEPFEGGELQPDVERSGWIAYEIPADVSTDDLTVAWSKTTIEGEISVNWE